MTSEDPRLKPGAYLTNGRYLYEVLEAAPTAVVLQNAATDAAMHLDPAVVLQGFRLVMPAVEVPDYPPAPSTVA